MEKAKQRNIRYNPTSRNESFLLDLIKRNRLVVFQVAELRSLSGWDRSRIYNTIFSLERKGAITRVKRDTYTLEENVNENLFEIATESVKPSYISFWTALSHYGFTEQQVKTVQLVSTKQFRKMEFDSHRIEVTTFLPERFYGYQHVQGFVIAEKEKALVDSLFQPDKCGGLDEYAKCLKRSWEHLNKRRFLNYILRFNNKSLISRAGYLIKALGLEGSKIEDIGKDHMSKSFVILDPNGRETLGYDHRWKVIINHRIKEEKVV